MFSRPWFFLLLLLTPLIWWRPWIRAKAFPANLTADRGAGDRPGWRVRLRRLPEILRMAALVFLIVALADPVRVLPSDTTRTTGLAIALALDRSGSMQVDIPLNKEWISRFTAVKRLTDEFLKDRSNDQIALISFARYPETHTPLTLNKEILREFLSSLELARGEEEDGTAIGDALALATARLAGSQGEGPAGLVILLTDGQNNQGERSPLQAAQEAARRGIRVYPIGLGGQGTVIEETGLGRRRIPVGSDLDAATLEEVARLTGGRFFHLEDLSGLTEVYREIEKLEKRALEGELGQRRESDFQFWLLLALASVLAEALVLVWPLRRLA